MFEESLTLLSSLLGNCGGLGEVDLYFQDNALLSCVIYLPFNIPCTTLPPKKGPGSLASFVCGQDSIYHKHFTICQHPL